MELTIFLRTFGIIFLAELGDKTQLATLSMAASSASRWSVFAGSAVALACTSLLAVLVGQGISKVVPAALLEKFVGLLFIAVGVWYLVAKD